MSFCPKWVFEAACAAAGADYLSRQLDLLTVANGYSAVLSESYQPIAPEEIAGVVEPILRFLDELNAGDTAVKSFKAYVYSLRNEVVELAPAGWKLADIEESEVIQALAKQNLSPLDFI